jgi:Mad3/BUB1 homology region 1.
MSKQYTDIPDWELYKENAAPLERGRDVEKLSRALAPDGTASSLLHRQQQDHNIRAFERLVRPVERFAKLYEERKIRDKNEIDEVLSECKVDDDPIVHWLRYIKYHEETYPSDTHAQFLLKERCTHSLLHHPKYVNDVRFIRVCVLYADRTDNPQEQFKLFHQHKIGSEVAIFWLAWAWVAEKRKDFQFADKIFRKAIQKKAQPGQIVNQRYKQFQRRMSRNWLNANSSNPDSVYDNEDDEGQQNRRGALVGLTEEGVRQNHRGRAANTMANNNQVSRNGRAGPMSEQQNNLNASNKPNGQFSIYADDDDDNNNGYDLNVSIAHNDENVVLPRIVKQIDRMKENTLSAETWNERGGLHGQTLRGSENEDDRDLPGASSVVSRWASSTGDSLGAVGTSGQAAFQVFVDEDCAGKEEETKPTKHRRTNDRGLKHRLDDSKQPFRPLFSSLSSSSIEGSESSASRAKHHSNPSLTEKISKISLSVGTEMPRNEKAPLGFDKSLLVDKERNRREQCFEEYRAKLRKWKSTPASANFNLLHKVKASSLSDSCMEYDETSTIDEIDMDEASRSISTIHEDRDMGDYNNDGYNVRLGQSSQIKAPKKETKSTQSKKVLFGVNTSFGNRSSNRANNTSTASSTVDENDAVGVVGDREETLNTRFAARELSMMFSSPMGLDHSIMPSAKKNCEKLLFPVYRDDSFASQEVVQEEAHVSKNHKTEFAIFCDDDKESVNQSKEETSLVQQRFAIHNIHESSHPTNVLKSEVATRNNIRSDDSDSDDDSFVDDGVVCNGDTASLADIMDVMKDISPDGIRHSTNGRSSKSTGLKFGIFCDDIHGGSENDPKVDDGTILTADYGAFGDLSFIPSAADGDTCNLQEELKNLSIT